jgi:hypothetical protein
LARLPKEQQFAEERIRKQGVGAIGRCFAEAGMSIGNALPRSAYCCGCATANPVNDPLMTHASEL